MARWKKILLWGGLGLLLSISANTPIVLIVIVYGLPGGILLFYLRQRHIGLRPGHSWIPPAVFSVLLSVGLVQSNSLLLWGHPPGLAWTPDLMLAGLASLFSVGAMILVELTAPDMLPETCSLHGWLHRLITVLLACMAALTGVTALIMHHAGLFWILTAILSTVQVIDRRSGTVPPALNALLRYTVIYAIIMSVAIGIP